MCGDERKKRYGAHLKHPVKRAGEQKKKDEAKEIKSFNKIIIIIFLLVFDDSLRCRLANVCGRKKREINQRRS